MLDSLLLVVEFDERITGCLVELTRRVGKLGEALKTFDRRLRLVVEDVIDRAAGEAQRIQSTLDPGDQIDRIEVAESDLVGLLGFVLRSERELALLGIRRHPEFHQSFAVGLSGEQLPVDRGRPLLSRSRMSSPEEAHPEIGRDSASLEHMPSLTSPLLFLLLQVLDLHHIARSQNVGVSSFFLESCVRGIVPERSEEETLLIGDPCQGLSLRHLMLLAHTISCSKIR